MTRQIRQAHADDLPQVLALYAQPGLDDGQVMPLAQAREVFAEFARYPNYRLFVSSTTSSPSD